MNHHRLRVGLIAAVALLAQTALAGPISAQDATPAAGATVEQITVVTPASRTNQGWDQQAADGVEAVAKEAGIEAVVAENAGYDDITPVLRGSGRGRRRSDHLPRQRLPDRLPGVRRRVRGVPVAVIENPDAVIAGISFPISRPRRRKSPTSPVCWPAKRRKRARSGWSSPASRRPGTT